MDSISAMAPEGDNYNKEREEQLYAGITNRTMLQRRYVEMVASGAPQDQINECLSAIAQTDRDISRLSLELHNSTQGRNLNIFMVRMEAALKEYEANNTTLLAGVNNNLTLLNLTVEQVLAVSKAGAARLGKLEEQFAELDERDRRQHEESKAEREELSARIKEIERLIADRPAQRELEHRQLLEALQRDRGDADR